MHSWREWAGRYLVVQIGLDGHMCIACKRMMVQYYYMEMFGYAVAACSQLVLCHHVRERQLTGLRSLFTYGSQVSSTQGFKGER